MVLLNALYDVRPDGKRVQGCHFPCWWHRCPVICVTVQTDLSTVRLCKIGSVPVAGAGTNAPSISLPLQHAPGPIKLAVRTHAASLT